MNDQLQSIRSLFNAELSSANKKEELLDLKSSFLGKKGKLSQLMGELRSASLEGKKTAGPLINQLKQDIEAAVSEKLLLLEYQSVEEKLLKDSIDPSLRDRILEKGLQGAAIHPTVVLQQKIEDIFLSMGFEVLDGPHIEDDYHNFEALNIPADHPARDMQDTFWFSDKTHLLRTHTSTIQVRGMKERRPPFRFVGPGKVFRSERTDASHEFVFHQLEGMMVDKEITVANLIFFMKALLSEIFGKEMKIRLRPGFFPFVEPGFELDIACLICSGKGCSVCKKSGWVELLPCGMVHPNVLKMGGVDPDEYSGFAFGLGLDRLVMMNSGIDDIRYLHGADLRFHSQFCAY